MADSKITALTAITTVNPATYPLVIVDTSDTSMAITGTTKKVTTNQLLGSGGTATLASATITGDLTVDTSTLKVDSANDRVGVGTASPAAGAKLGVLGATSVSTSDYIGSSTWAARFIASSNGASSGISFLTNSVSGFPTPASIHATPIADYRSALVLTYSADSSGAGYFAVNRSNPIGSNTLEHYKIDNAGIATWSNVGGVAGTAMTLNATGLGVGLTPAAGDGSGVFKAAGTGSGATNTRIGLDVREITSGNAAGIWLGAMNNENTGVIGSRTASGNIAFQTFNGSSWGERMRIDYTGNVGIGITPSAWGSGLKAVELGAKGNAAFSTANAIDGFFVVNNAYYDTAYKYGMTGYASRYTQYQGQHQFFTAPSGTAGNAITFTQAMTLDASGNLSIGVTSPRSKADVYGTLTVGSNTAPNCDFKRDVAISGADSGIGSLNYGARYDATNYGVGALITGQSAGAWTSTSTPGYISFRTTPSSATTPVEGMRLDASGRLLVGTANASVTSETGCRLLLNNGATGHFTIAVTTNQSTAATSCYDFYSTSAAAYRFYVTSAGTINATNTTISAISDARLKENVQDIDVGLGAILALKPRKFDWKAGKGKDIKGDRGFIAQEFEQVFPQLVDEWKDAAPEGEAPYKSVRQDLIPVLVKAIQELAARVQTLETR